MWLTCAAHVLFLLDNTALDVTILVVPTHQGRLHGCVAGAAEQGRPMVGSAVHFT